MRVHDSRVRGDWSTKHNVDVGGVDDDHLILFIDLLSYTNEVVGLEGQCLQTGESDVSAHFRRSRATRTRLEGDRGRLNADGGKLEVLAKCDGFRNVEGHGEGDDTSSPSRAPSRKDDTGLG